MPPGEGGTELDATIMGIDKVRCLKLIDDLNPKHSPPELYEKRMGGDDMYGIAAEESIAKITSGKPEHVGHVPAAYMARQPHVTHDLRAVLVDWMFEVALVYRFQPRTLFVAVSLVDRFLSRMKIQLEMLQLAGVACMLLAAKLDEIAPPSVDDFVYITDSSFTADEVVKMESSVMQTLNFDITADVPLDHAPMLFSAVGAGPEVIHSAKYLMSLTLVQAEHCFSIRPADIAAGAVLAALRLNNANDSMRALPRALLETRVVGVADMITELFQTAISGQEVGFAAINRNFGVLTSTP